MAAQSKTSSQLVQDKKTGNWYDFDLGPSKKKPPVFKEMFQLSRQGSEWLALAGLTSREYKVLMALVSISYWHNTVRAVNKDISRLTGIDVTNVSKVIASLHARNAIRYLFNEGNVAVFRIHPVIGWKGDGKCFWSAVDRAGDLISDIGIHRFDGVQLRIVDADAYLKRWQTIGTRGIKNIREVKE